ncbi:diaminopimelate decarboxylase [Microbacterium sp. SSW1-59]|uniref:diaminopimelate decarboxylase n=1 Tax=Microbacterium xanthum TaxID=3079794 RepID=UPI002AD1DD01|nr:diaminopimelate decarboxylase [Microbacterium sp. SSW1-59]MDZ8201716.1 diaminopimelate decarboxylase [Microbacterium sp. SSW1-59]
MSATSEPTTAPPAPADVNALAEKVWPPDAERNDDGSVAFGGVPVADLQHRFGTPLYVLDENAVRARAREVREAFDIAAERHGTRAKVYYAAKAFLCTETVRWVTAEGLSVDVATGGELAVALAAGAPAERLGLHGNNKSEVELTRAVTSGVGTVVVDSLIEIERLAAIAAGHGVVQDVSVRVNSGVHAETHDFLATAHEDQKFGFALDAAESAVARIRELPSLRFIGLHCHIGSQIFGAAGFAESASRVIGLHARLLEGGEIPTVNLGGGFGIAYTEADDPTPIADLAEEIVSAVARECAARGIAVPVLAFEPGRAIVGRAGVTLYEVGTVKPVTVADDLQRLYVSVDGGMSDNARTALYGAAYSARIVSRRSDVPPALSRVVGKHCEAGDIVVDAEWLPGDVAPGDLLAVPATGAYCFSLASNYNYIPRPPVVAVGGGAARVIVRGETIDDLLARDAGVPAPTEGNA